MQPTVVGVAHEVGVCGLNTDPACDGGVGIGFGSTRTWKYEAPLVLSTNAAMVPSADSVGDVLICPPDCVTVLYRMPPMAIRHCTPEPLLYKDC